MYALVAAVVIATPSAYVNTTTTTAVRVVVRQSESTARLQIVKPVTISARRRPYPTPHR
jgi:hypothetical protein